VIRVLEATRNSETKGIKMKKNVNFRLTLITLLIFAATVAGSEEITGVWSGTLEIQNMKLKLFLRSVLMKTAS